MKHIKGKRKQSNKEKVRLIRIESLSEKHTREIKNITQVTGTLVEAAVIAVLTFFCVACFLTGMDLPVRKELILLEVVILSILFEGTFRIHKGSGYIFSGELLLYGLLSFVYRNEISQGLAAVYNNIAQKAVDYYSVNLPFFQEVKDSEQYIRVFLIFITVMLTGITAYAVVSKAARFFLCLIQFPIALGALLVGYLPEGFYFVGYVVSVALLLTMPRQQEQCTDEKKIFRSMTIKTAALVLFAFLVSYGVLCMIVSEKKYQSVDTEEQKLFIQEQIQKLIMGKTGGFGSFSSVGGLSRGKLGRTDQLRYTGKECLEVTVSGNVTFPLYLKSYVGKRYENDQWETFGDAQDEKEEDAVRTMENGEEQGAAWIEKFRKKSKWFSEAAFDQKAFHFYEKISGKDNSSSLYERSLSSQYEEGEDGQDYYDIGGTTGAEVMLELPEKRFSYEEIQAILNEPKSTVSVKNTGRPKAEKYVPYGRILKEDREADGIRSYTGYPNLNTYVKGNMGEYGYFGGNLINDILEKCSQSLQFIDLCSTCFSEEEHMMESDITLKEMIRTVEKRKGKTIKDSNGLVNFAGSDLIKRDGEVKTDSVSCVEIIDNGSAESKYYIAKNQKKQLAEASEGEEFQEGNEAYMLYLDTNLSVKDAVYFLQEVNEWKKNEESYEDFIGNYQTGEIVVEKVNDTLWQLCFEFKRAQDYDVMSIIGDANAKLEYIGQCVAYVKDYLSENMEYSLQPGRLPEGESFIDYYLYQQKKGYCSHFATIGTVMFRMLGVPARYVEGFVVQPEDVSEGTAKKKTISVKDESAHAWVEIYVQDYGWVPIEVTPGYDEGVEQSELENLVNNWNKESNNQKTTFSPQDGTSTPGTTETAEKAQTSQQSDKTFILDGKELRIVKIVIQVLLVCGMVTLVLWLRYIYIWKKRIAAHAGKRENERVCNYYAKMEHLLKGIHVMRPADHLRDLLNAYVRNDVGDDVKAVAVIEETADQKQWAEFIDILNIAAYSSHNVTGQQLETVRLMEEKMRREVFAHKSKIKVMYWLYIRVL